MDYFCYISRRKVDRLYQTISSEGDEWTETKINERDFGAEVGAEFSIANIINLAVVNGHSCGCRFPYSIKRCALVCQCQAKNRMNDGIMSNFSRDR